MLQCRLRGLNRLSGETTLSTLLFLPSENDRTLKRKNQFFPFKVDPFSEENCCAGKQKAKKPQNLPLFKKKNK